MPVPDRRPRILLLNTSLAGDSGNTAVLLAELRAHLAPHADLSAATLASPDASNDPAAPGDANARDFASLRPQLAAADAFVIGTGTHWDSWSSLLQKFLEDATPAEGTALWLGKPAAVIVSEHSTGGKSILSRLQGVLVTLGCTIPPMSGLVLSRAALLAAEHAPADTATRDLWCRDDLAVIAHNLLEAARGTRNWRVWPVDRTDFAARWLE